MRARCVEIVGAERSEDGRGSGVKVEERRRRERRGGGERRMEKPRRRGRMRVVVLCVWAACGGPKKSQVEIENSHVHFLPPLSPLPLLPPSPSSP